MKLFILLLISVPLTGFAQDNAKPSPIGPRRAQAAAAPAQTPDLHNHGKDTAAAAIPTGPNIGTACFYRQKTAVAPDEAALGGMTATHGSFPKGTRVKVTNLANQKSVVVTITDHATGTDRIICLNQPAAERLGFAKMGTAQVRVEKQ